MLASKIILENIEVDGKIVRYHFSVSDDIKGYFTTNVLFNEYDIDMTDVPISILTIPFVSILSGFSWTTGSIIYVDEIDRTFYDSYKFIKLAYQNMHHDYPFKGNLVASIFVDNKIEKSKESLLLFGGGVDCHASLIRNKDSVKELCNIYGWLKVEDENNYVDVSDCQMTADVAKRMGIGAEHVRSNFATFINLKRYDKYFGKFIHGNMWYIFLHPMAFISISIPVAFKQHIGEIIIASSFTKGEDSCLCGSDITTDSEFKFAGNGCVLHDGFELNRQQKVGLIVYYQKERGNFYPLQVCSFNDHNCCECEKCFRTIIALVAENANIKDFGFNIREPLVSYFQKLMKRKLALWGIEHESDVYWAWTIQRMKDNYENIKEKEFVDWFLNYDFKMMKKQYLREYYRNNFFNILKRKIKSVLQK